MAAKKNIRETKMVEEMALQILQQEPMFKCTNLFLSEKPDIQTEDKRWGIEVVRAIDPQITKAEDTFLKKGKKPNVISGVTIECETHEDSYCPDEQMDENISYATSFKMMIINSRDCREITVLQHCIENKLKKLNANYYPGFSKMCLFVFTSVPNSAKEFFVNILKDYELKHYDYYFFCNCPHFDVHMKKIPQQIWVIDKAEISDS